MPNLYYLDERPIFDFERLLAEAFARGGKEEEERVRKQMKLVKGNANGVRANQPTVEYRDRIVEVQKIVHVDRPIEVCLFRLSNKHVNNHRYACWIINLCAHR